MTILQTYVTILYVSYSDTIKSLDHIRHCTTELRAFESLVFYGIKYKKNCLHKLSVSSMSLSFHDVYIVYCVSSTNQIVLLFFP